MGISINCPKCGGKSSVSDTRKRDELRRRRKCLDCGHSFHTVEILEEQHMKFTRLLNSVKEALK